MKAFIISCLIATTSMAAALPPMTGKTIPQNESFKWNWNMAKKGTVVVFLSAVCPCSNGHVDYLKKLKNNFPDYHFIAIHSNADEDQKMTDQYFFKVSLNFDLIQDEKSYMANLLSAHKTPHSYVISPEGEILYQGGVTGSSKAERAENFYLFDALKGHQLGKSIEVSKTRVLGCEIERN
jgi:hypothetical protein